MILYLDTSALVKKYFKEKNTSEVISAWKSSLGIATSAVAYAELLAAVYRKTRETRIKKSAVTNVVKLFHEDWSSFIIVAVDNRLNETIHKIIADHGLRGFDALHLASALTIGSAVADSPATMKGLSVPAQTEGLETLALRFKLQGHR